MALFKLQKEYCERRVADAGEILLMLLCENASLSRLSIRIFVVQAFRTTKSTRTSQNCTNPIDRRDYNTYHFERTVLRDHVYTAIRSIWRHRLAILKKAL